MRPLVVIQARTGSSRFPGKVFADIGGMSALERVVTLVADYPTVVATTTLPNDAVIVDRCRAWGVDWFTGRVHDVLDRYYGAAALFKGDPVIRVTADCPLLDPTLIPPLIRLIGSGYDYAGVRGAPRGRHCEAFTWEILAAADRWATDSADREHVVTWMLRNGACGWHEVRYPDKRAVELNTPADLRRIRRIAA